MRILVTGGAGFIGSHIVDLLVADGAHEVVVLDSFRPDVHPTTPDYLNDGAAYIRGDVRDPDAWQAALDGVEAVCHQAARVGLGVDMGDVTSYVDDNDVGTAAGLQAMHQAGFGGRIVLASSMVVYGEGRYRCDEHGVVRPAPRVPADLDAGRYDPSCPSCGSALEPEPVTEDAPVDPRNVYAATKLHQEHLVAAYCREHDAVGIALRYHNVYGRRLPLHTPYAGVAALFKARLKNGDAPLVFEDGLQLRDFVHVTDVARANALALTGDAANGAFNIASGTPRTVLDLATELAAAAGPGAAAPQVVGGYRLGDVRHVFASTARATERLGFDAAMPFRDGIADLFEER